MADPASLTLFVIAAAVVLITPGPAVIYIVARSIDQGRVAGWVSALGVAVGSLVHVAAAALGVSAVMLSSAPIFDTVKYAGAAYLIFLGVQRLRTNDVMPTLVKTAPQRLWRLFLDGVVVNVLNPKTVLFLFAFLPQFVDADRGDAAERLVMLGVLFVVMGLLSDGLYALVAGSLLDHAQSTRRLQRLQRYLTAAILIGLGATTALAGRAAA